MLASFSTLRTLQGVGLWTLITICGGCHALDALSECPPETTTVEAGATAGSVDPEVSVTSLFPTTDGVLTWTRTDQSTPVHVTMARGRGPALAEWNDCSGSNVLTGFSVPIDVQIRTDDGLVDTTVSGTATEGPDGRVGSIETSGLPLSDVSDAAVLYSSSGSYASVTLDLANEGGTGLRSGQISENPGVIATLAFTP